MAVYIDSLLEDDNRGESDDDHHGRDVVREVVIEAGVKWRRS